MSDKGDLLDAVLHQPVRTRLVAFLAGRGEATFKELKDVLDVTDGNLDAHMKKLLGAGYVKVRKERVAGRVQSFFALTAVGEQAFRRYVRSLQTVLDIFQSS